MASDRYELNTPRGLRYQSKRAPQFDIDTKCCLRKSAQLHTLVYANPAIKYVELMRELQWKGREINFQIYNSNLWENQCGLTLFGFFSRMRLLLHLSSHLWIAMDVIPLIDFAQKFDLDFIVWLSIRWSVGSIVLYDVQRSFKNTNTVGISQVWPLSSVLTQAFCITLILACCAHLH